MNLFNKLLISIALSIIFTACSKEDPLIIDDTFFLRHKGSDMPVYVNGNRESKTFVVVMHGAGSFGLSFRNGAFTEILEKKFAFVYWDQRGQGTSQGHYSSPENIIDLMASDIVALVNVLKEKYSEDINLFLMGHSFGGMLSLEALLNQGLQDDIRGFISISGAHDFELTKLTRHQVMLEVANEQINTGNSVVEWAVIIKELEELDPASDVDYNAILSLAVRSMRLIEDDGVVSAEKPSGLAVNTFLQNNPLTWQISHLFNQPVNYAIENNYSLSALLPQLNIPSSWLYGKYDFSVPFHVGSDGYSKAGSLQKEFIIFEESMHHLHYTESGYFAEKVLKFIDGVLHTAPGNLR